MLLVRFDGKRVDAVGAVGIVRRRHFRIAIPAAFPVAAECFYSLVRVLRCRRSAPPG